MKKTCKKLLAMLLSAALLLSCGAAAYAAPADTTLRCREDGSFKIAMFNDLQDRANTSARTLALIEGVLDTEQPDLVVIVGDTISDVYPTANLAAITTTISNLLRPMEERGIPFLFTYGNHDHDMSDRVSEAQQMEIYKSFSTCAIPSDGYNEGTYNVPVLTADGSKAAFNIYMMDTNNKNEEVGGYAGVTSEQVGWYLRKSNELKAANGGEVLPSLLFQHIPVKEIYQFLEKTDDYDNAFFSTADHNWYRLKTDRLSEGENYCMEAPCSENQDVTTGQYEAWLAQGDIIGAFFGHDHINSFTGVTEEGIRMGYNAGSGFATYGLGGKRSARIFVLNESDPAAFTTHCVTYNQLTGSNINFVFTDLISMLTITYVMRVVYKLFGKLLTK